MSGFNDFEDRRAVPDSPGVRGVAWVAVALGVALIVGVALAMPGYGLPVLLGLPVIALLPSALGALFIRTMSVLESRRR